MLESLKGTQSERRLRVFACACCRRIWHLLEDERSRSSVEVAERYANGLVSERELAQASAIAEEAFKAIPWEPNGMAGAVKLAASAVWGATAAATEETIFGVGPVIGLAINTSLQAADAAEIPESERASQADLLRDILGNPFRDLDR